MKCCSYPSLVLRGFTGGVDFFRNYLHKMERCPKGIWTKTPWILTNACSMSARRGKEKSEQDPVLGGGFISTVWCVAVCNHVQQAAIRPTEDENSNNYIYDVL